MTKKPLYIIACLIPLFLFTPYFVNAHVKWFTTVEPVKSPIQDTVSIMFILVALLSATILTVLPFIITKMKRWIWAQKCEVKLQSYAPYSESILKYGTAIALIIQVLSGTIFALEFPTQSEIIIWVIWGIIIALIIPHDIATKVGSLGILCLFCWITIDNCLECTIDYIFYIAIAINLFFSSKLKKWKIPILYFFTGFSLCWVAMEKVVYPLMAIDVVIKHEVPTFGFPPDVFVLLCAFIEFVIGYLLFIGILNRTLAVVVTTIFIMTSLLFGVTEIIGHFMLHIVLIIFLFEGTNNYSMPIKLCNNKTQQVVFIFVQFILGLLALLLLYYIFT